MSMRRSEDASIELACVAGLGECAVDPAAWKVDGRFNAEGEFEAFDSDELLCPVCGGEQGEPTDTDVRLADG